MRAWFVAFLRRVSLVTADHVRVLLRYFSDLLRDRRIGECELALRCLRQCSCHEQACAQWRLPFYVLLAAVQEATRQGWTGPVTAAPLYTEAMVPKLVSDERTAAVQWWLEVADSKQCQATRS